jgi:hypothetical protein
MLRGRLPPRSLNTLAWCQWSPWPLPGLLPGGGAIARIVGHEPVVMVRREHGDAALSIAPAGSGANTKPRRAGDRNVDLVEIGEWIGSDTARSRSSDSAQRYQAAGLDYAPPLEPLETIDELTRVIGMTPELVDTLRPHLTLYGPALPDKAAADPTVSAALGYLAQQNETQALAPPAASGSPTLRIAARAQGPGSARSSATAIVRLTGARGNGYVLLAWDDAGD